MEGFGASAYLKNSIQELHPDTTVIQPNEAYVLHFEFRLISTFDFGACTNIKDILDGLQLSVALFVMLCPKKRLWSPTSRPNITERMG